MLKKEHRLSIKGKLKTTKTISTPYFVLKVADKKGEKSKFAIIVGKTVDKRAVYRNRLKRQIRVAIAKSIKRVKPDFEFLIIAQKEAVDSKTVFLEEELGKVLKKEGYLI